MEIINGRPHKLHTGDRIIADGWPSRTTALVLAADDSDDVTIAIGNHALAAETFDEEGYLQLKSKAGTHFGRIYPDKGTRCIHTNPFMGAFAGHGTMAP